MTKEEYFREFKEAISLYPYDVQMRMWNRLDTLIQGGLNRGIPEEELIGSLGSVGDMLNIIESDLANEGRGSYQTDQLLNNVEKGLTKVGTLMSSALKGAASLIDKAVEKREVQQTPTAPRMELVASDLVNEDVHTLIIDASDGLTDLALFMDKGHLSYAFKATQGLFQQPGSYFEVTCNDGVVLINVEHPKGIRGGAAQLSVVVPMSVKTLSIKNIDGNISFEELRVDTLSLQTASGDIRCEACYITDGSLTTKSGDIAVGISEGGLTCKSTSGDIRVSNHLLGKLLLRTTSGDIHVSNMCDIPMMIAETTSGDIDCSLHSDKTAIEINTTTGDFVNHTSFTGFVAEKGKWVLGSGEGAMKLKSVSGDIQLTMK